MKISRNLISRGKKPTKSVHLVAKGVLVGADAAEADGGQQPASKDEPVNGILESIL
jgi:hypothetical protein